MAVDSEASNLPPTLQRRLDRGLFLLVRLPPFFFFPPFLQHPDATGRSAFPGPIPLPRSSRASAVLFLPSLSLCSGSPPWLGSPPPAAPDSFSFFPSIHETRACRIPFLPLCQIRRRMCVACTPLFPAKGRVFALQFLLFSPEQDYRADGFFVL